MNLWTKLGSIDRRIIYSLVVVAVVAPNFVPLGLPISTSPMTIQAYETVEMLSPGDLVIQVLDFSLGYRADLWDATVAVVDHCTQKGAAVAIVTLESSGPVMCEELVDLFVAQGAAYGKDIANLGYLPGGETGVAAFARDLPSAMPTDFRGNEITSLPMFSEVTDAKAISLVSVSTSNVGLEWVNQVQGPYGTPLVFLSGTMLVPKFTPFLQSGQIKGLLKGVGGAAEYERLLGKPGKATASMEVQSLAHLVVIVLIVLGNLSHVFIRKGGDTGGKPEYMG